MKGLIVLGGSLALLGTSGCAQYIAYKQPSPMDRSVLASGADRSRIAGTLGAPVSKEDNGDGTITETYKYDDGGAKNSAASKTARIVFYTAGDLFTVFLDQIIWMPLELAFRGTPYTADVTYEKVDRRWVATAYKEVDLNNQQVTTEVADKPKRVAQATGHPRGDGD